jgi:hypothetical protein
VKIGGLKTKSLAKLVTTLPNEPFLKWGLGFIGPIKLARRLTWNKYILVIIYINSVSFCVCDGGFGGWGKGEVGEATGDLSTMGNRFHFLINCCISLWTHVRRGPETHITFNKIVPSNSRAQKLFRTSSSYFLLLLLRPFPRSNC